VDAIAWGTSADYRFDFFVLTADANHHRSVNALEFTLLAMNFNKPGQGVADGDFNYVGKLNALELNLLATALGTSLPAPAGRSMRCVHSKRWTH
jgi:hypothetical protein